MPPKKLTQQESKKIIESAIKDFKGLIPTLETAIGALFIGQKYGWKVLYIVHDARTLKKYEKILKINFKECLDEIGPDAHRSLGFKAVSKVSNFWKAVKGEIQIKDRKETE